MAGTIKHRHQSALPDGGYDIDVDEWNDSLVVAGGTAGQFFKRDTGAADGWALGAILSSDLPDLSGTTITVGGITTSGAISAGSATITGAISAGSASLTGALTAATIAATSGAFSSFISVGPSPATTGAIRLANNQSISARNAANSADVSVLSLNASNQVAIVGAPLVLGPAGAAAPAIGDLVVNRGGTSPGTGGIFFGSSNSHYIYYTGSWLEFKDSLVPNPGNTLDLGTGSSLWRAGYFGTSLSIGTLPAQTGAIRLANNSGVSWRNAANSADSGSITYTSSNDLLLRSGNVLYLRASGGDGLAVGPGGTVPEVDNARDFGYAGGRWRSGYFGTSIVNSGYYETTEMSPPTAPAANGARVYADDNGSGKTRLMVRFATGSPVQIAIEP